MCLFKDNSQIKFVILHQTILWLSRIINFLNHPMLVISIAIILCNIFELVFMLCHKCNKYNCLPWKMLGAIRVILDTELFRTVFLLIWLFHKHILNNRCSCSVLTSIADLTFIQINKTKTNKNQISDIFVVIIRHFIRLTFTFTFGKWHWARSLIAVVLCVLSCIAYYR